MAKQTKQTVETVTLPAVLQTAAREIASSFGSIARAQGGLKAAVKKAGDALKKLYRSLDERKAMANATWAMATAQLGEDFTKGTLKQYKTLLREAAGLPKQKQHKAAKAEADEGEAEADSGDAVDVAAGELVTSKQAKLALFVRVLAACGVQTVKEATDLASEAFSRMAKR